MCRRTEVKCCFYSPVTVSGDTETCVFFLIRPLCCCLRPSVAQQPRKHGELWTHSVICLLVIFMTSDSTQATRLRHLLVFNLATFTVSVVHSLIKFFFLLWASEKSNFPPQINMLFEKVLVSISGAEWILEGASCFLLTERSVEILFLYTNSYFFDLEKFPCCRWGAKTHVRSMFVSAARKGTIQRRTSVFFRDQKDIWITRTGQRIKSDMFLKA